MYRKVPSQCPPWSKRPPPVTSNFKGASSKRPLSKNSTRMRQKLKDDHLITGCIPSVEKEEEDNDGEEDPLDVGEL